MTILKDCRRVLVIIPCHNEAGRVGEVVRSVKKLVPTMPVVVIDDASIDSTAKEAVEAGAIVVSHCVNLGYGAAILTGYLYALRSDTDFVLQMDGDGQHGASDIPELLGPVVSGQADLVIGSRYAKPVRTDSGSRLRRLGHKLFAAFLFFFTGSELTDPTSGFQCLNRRTLRFYCNSWFPHDFPDTDVLIMAHYAGLRIMEKPVKIMPRVDGESMHSGLTPFYYLVKLFISILIVVLNRKEMRET